MDAPVEMSWAVLAGVALAGALCGWSLRYFRGRWAERAAAHRIAALCEQLDAKDRKLEGLRAELQAERERALDLQSALDARPVSSALRLEENEDPAFFRRLVRAL